MILNIKLLIYILFLALLVPGLSLAQQNPGDSGGLVLLGLSYTIIIIIFSVFVCSLIYGGYYREEKENLLKNAFKRTLLSLLAIFIPIIVYLVFYAYTH